MEISSIILPAGLSTAAAATPAPDQTIQGKILLQLRANAHTHLSLKGWSIKNPRGKKEIWKKTSCYHRLLWQLTPYRKLREVLLSVEEVNAINTFCVLNTAAGKFSFGKSSLNFKKRNEKFSNWKYPIAKTIKQKDPQTDLCYVLGN